MLTTYQRSRLLVALAVIACFVIAWYAGAWLGIPFMNGQADSLLLHPAPWLAVGGTWITLGLMAVMGTLLAGRVRPDAGLFAACVGLSALSIRGGTIREILMVHPSAGVYWVLAAEGVVLLLGLIGAAYAARFVAELVRPSKVRAPALGEAAPVEVPYVYAIASVLCQVLLMAILVMLLARSSMKAQVLIAVFVSAAVATACSGVYFHHRSLAAVTCAGPMLVAVGGYLLAGPNMDLLTIALVDQPLARPIPLDYASMGAAGAIVGAWFGAKHEIHWVDQLVAVLTGGSMPVRREAV